MGCGYPVISSRRSETAFPSYFLSFVYCGLTHAPKRATQACRVAADPQGWCLRGTGVPALRFLMGRRGAARLPPCGNGRLPGLGMPPHAPRLRRTLPGLGAVGGHGPASSRCGVRCEQQRGLPTAAEPATGCAGSWNGRGQGPVVRRDCARGVRRVSRR